MLICGYVVVVRNQPFRPLHSPTKWGHGLLPHFPMEKGGTSWGAVAVLFGRSCNCGSGIAY